MRTDPPIPAMLRESVEHAQRHIEALRATPHAEWESLVAQQEPPRNFFRAVTKASLGGCAVIGEVARRGVRSTGVYRAEYEGDRFSPHDIARNLEEAGAAALVCATDPWSHGGSPEFVQVMKEACALPVLRRSLILDSVQLWESRALGADAVVLTADILTEAEIVDMLILGQQLQLTTVLEVHSMDSLLRVRPHVGFPHRAYSLLALHSMDLETGRTDHGELLRLADFAEDKSVLLAAGGIATRSLVMRLAGLGVRGVMVGEYLMSAGDPGAALRTLRGAGTLLGGQEIEGKDDASGDEPDDGEAEDER